MWRNRKVLVTGGASFIGSHLVDSLIEKGAEVTVADDLSSGKLENFERPLNQGIKKNIWTANNLKIFIGDLKNLSFAKSVMKDQETVFHLAALHGGRGYIDSHPAQCCSNMLLDELVFQEAWNANVERICFASSACVYPSYLQESTGSSYLLKETDANPFVRDKAFADLEYGWAKLMGEMALAAYHRQYGMKTAAVRIFTAYGPRENETHAIIALIARAFINQDPFIIWGTGNQDRNFTYVQDIVDGLMLASERIEDGSPINAGRADRLTLNESAELVFKISNWRPKKIVHDTTKPQGVASRAADLTKARTQYNWEPKVGYEEGFKKTIDWYFKNKSKSSVKANFDRLLHER
jgi:nucleoside-diphosphate-sugar epimerase